MKKKGWLIKSISKNGQIEVTNTTSKETKVITWAQIRPKSIQKKQKLQLNSTLIEKNELYYLKTRKLLYFFIVVGCAALIGFASFFILNQDKEPEFNRYVENMTTENTNTESGETRFRFNTTMTVKKNTIQNINLENVNKDKYLQVKIKLENDYVFDSGLIEYGKILKSDVLSKEVSKGKHDATAELYVLNTDKQPITQRNVKIKLIVE